MFRTISLAILSGLLLWAAWPGRFSVSTLYCFCAIITAGNELQKRKSVFAHTFSFHVVEYINYILDSTCYLVWVMMAVLINSLLMASAFTLFSWIKADWELKEDGGLCLRLACIQYLHFNWDLSWRGLL